MERPPFTPEEAIELSDEDTEDVTDRGDIEIALQEARGGQVAEFKAPPPIPEKKKTLQETVEAAKKMPDNPEDAIGDMIEEATGIDFRPKDEVAEGVMRGLRVDQYKKEAAEAVKRAEMARLDRQIEEATRAIEAAAGETIELTDDDIEPVEGEGENRKTA